MFVLICELNDRFRDLSTGVYPLAVNLPEVGPGLTPGMMRQAANDFIKSELSLTAERLAENLAKREFTKLQKRKMKQAGKQAVPVGAEEEEEVYTIFDYYYILKKDNVIWLLADFKDFEGEESDELDEEGVEEEIDSEEEALDEEEEGENDEEEEEDDDDEIESEDSESEEEEQVADQKVILKGKKVNILLNVQLVLLDYLIYVATGCREWICYQKNWILGYVWRWRLGRGGFWRGSDKLSCHFT